MSHALTPSECIALIKNHGFAVQKKLGQNFLIDTNVLEGIVSFAGISKDDCVLEIGPGMGALTGYLVDAAGKVIAVEVDKMLIPLLEGSFSDCDNFLLINDDVMKVDLTSLIERENNSRPIKVVANLPYYITTPIIMKLLESDLPLESITIMIQKEVAHRMVTGPGSKDYGALSLAVQYYSKPIIGIEVTKNSFYPRPDVDSSVIRLDLYTPEERPVKCGNPELLFKVIRAAFGQRRKTLANALSNALDLNLSREQISKALLQMGKSETIRGEVLTLEEFAQLTEYLD